MAVETKRKQSKKKKSLVVPTSRNGFKQLVISNSDKHVAVLAMTIQEIISGHMSVPQGYCVIGLSTEMRNHLQFQWDVAESTNEQLVMDKRGRVKFIDAEYEEVDG